MCYILNIATSALGASEFIYFFHLQLHVTKAKFELIIQLERLYLDGI